MLKTLLLGLLLAPFLCDAHPGVGIVIDKKGNIYYTDLSQVWKLTPAGEKSIAVKGVHTHELYIDAGDNLFGEHLWYNGEAANTWGHFVWRLSPQGVLDTVVKPAIGFRSNYSFVRDASGNMYSIEHGDTTKFVLTTASGNISKIAEGKFKDVRWLHYGNGHLLFTDDDDLYRIDSNGKSRLLAEDISTNTTAFIAYAGKHSLLGIWTDPAENVYIANFSGQAVRKISPDGSVRTVMYSTVPWSPSGGVFDKEGNLWLMEYSFTNDVRVRKIMKDDLMHSSSLKSFLINDLLVWLLFGLIVVFLLMFLRRIRRRKKEPIILPKTLM